jgi:hypothetical protein
MALTVNHPLLKEVRVYAYMADVSTAGSAFITSPIRGKIVKMGSVRYAAITTADAAVTTEINGTAVTGGAWTLAFTSAAAGDVDTAEPTAANLVNEDDVIEFISDGASSTACPAMFWAVIQAG